MYTSRNHKVELDAHGRLKGITALSRRLKVSYGHLYMVITGKRDSKRLKAILKQIQPNLIKE